MGNYLAAIAERMSLSTNDWHTRFLQQARWTKNLREYLISRSGLNQSNQILEVGCGTGVLLAEAGSRSGLYPQGLDIDWERLIFASHVVSRSVLVCGDAHQLPYASASLDGCFCHYLLLWVKNPEVVVREMVRITRPGGPILVLAEPDYGGRIDYPEELEALGSWQTAALQNQGAFPQIGRRLPGLLTTAGLTHVEVGVIGGEWRAPEENDELTSEWAIIRADLKTLGDLEVSEKRTAEFFEADKLAREAGERVLFVPTFYAWGRVPE